MRTIHSRIAFGAIAALVCGDLHAVNSYGYDPNDAKTYIVTVPANETNTLDSASIGILTGGTVTNLVKRGDGTLSVSEDLSAFTGNVHIVEGVFLSRPQEAANTTLGSRTGLIAVSDGATLAVSTSVEHTSLTGKTIFFEGEGFGGQGALVNAEGNPMQNSKVFGKSLNLTGDGKIATYSIQWFYFISSGSVLELNGHTLTAYGSHRPVVIERPARYVVRSGSIVATGCGVEYSGGEGYYFSYPLRVMEDSQVAFNELATYYQGKLTLEAGAKIILYDSEDISETFTSDNSDTYQGEMELKDPVRNEVQLDGHRIAFNKKVSGGGLHLVGNGKNPGGQFRLSYNNNSFSNGLVAVDGVAVLIGVYAGLPNKGALILTNSSFTAYGKHSTGATWTLPQLHVHGTGLVANATGTWRNSVTKTGDGELVYNSWINSNALNLFGGRFTFPADPYPGTATPGVNDRIPQFKTINATCGTTLDLNGHGYTNDTLNGATTMLNCPEFAVKKAWTFPAEDAISDGGLSTAGRFRFIDGSTVTVTDIPAKVGPKGVSVQVLSASDGIIGFPGCTIGDRWSLSLSADGKSLVLKYPPKGLTVVVR